jgi:hypothetical protein
MSGRNRTALQSVEFFLSKKCGNVARVYAKIDFFNKHPFRKYPQYYEDPSAKGYWMGKFDHPDVIAHSNKILESFE